MKTINETAFESWGELDVQPGFHSMWPELVRNVVVPCVNKAPSMDGTLNDDIWKQAVTINPAHPVNHEMPMVETVIYLCFDYKHLYAGIKASLPANADMDQQALATEQITLAFDSAHNHRCLDAILVNALGEISRVEDMARVGFGDQIGFMCDRYVSPNDRLIPKPVTSGIEAAVKVNDDSWTATIAIPFAFFQFSTPLPGTTIGFNACRATSVPGENFVYRFTWMPHHRMDYRLVPMTMGDMGFHKQKVSIERADFPDCSWGVNRAMMEFRNNTAETIQAAITTRGVASFDGPPHQFLNEPVNTGPVDLPPNRVTAVPVEYHVPVRFMPSMFEFELRNACTRDRLFRTTYDLGTCPVVYPYGQEKGIDSPCADDPDFIEKRMRYVVSRQPLLRRKTTCQGAPGDFHIEAVDNSISFNLMDDATLQHMGDWLCRLYDNDIDRVAGAAYLASQQAIGTYDSKKSPYTSRLSPLSIMRIGGGMCSEFGRMVVGILTHTASVTTGRPFNAKVLDVHNHMLAAVEMDGKWAPVDATPPNFKVFFRRDNATLASYEELAGDPQLILDNGSTIAKFYDAPFRRTDPASTPWPNPLEDTELRACPYPFGKSAEASVPGCSDPGFIERRICHAASRQPLFSRRTTRDGASSDFVLESEDGSTRFNLMEPGALRSIGGWLCELYDDDVDRLMGAALFVSQPAVMRVDTLQERFSYILNPLSILRIGGGTAPEFARALAGILGNTMNCDGTGMFSARILTMEEHTVTIAWMHDRWVPLDGMPGRRKAFFRHDNGTLAGYRELRDNPLLQTHNGEDASIFLSGHAEQEICSRLNWPDGAPDE